MLKNIHLHFHEQLLKKNATKAVVIFARLFTFKQPI